MSFILSQMVFDGFILSGDLCASKISIDAAKTKVDTPIGNVTLPQFYVPQSSTHSKIAVTKNNIGIAHTNQTYIKDISITTHVNNFIFQLDTEKYKTPLLAAQHLMDYMQQIDPSADSVFHVCGYDFTDPHRPMPCFYYLQINPYKFEVVNKDMFTPISTFNTCHPVVYDLIKYIGPNYKAFSMQDAIDFAVFLTNTTRKTMIFSGIGEGISNDIDILSITLSGAKWIRHKELQVNEENL